MEIADRTSRDFGNLSANQKREYHLPGKARVEHNIFNLVSLRGDTMVVSLILGLIFFSSIYGFNWSVLIVAISTVVLHKIFEPNWKEFFKTFFYLIVNIPNAVLKGFTTLFSFREIFEIREVRCKICEVLSITLVPDSVVLESDVFHHVHRVVIGWRGARSRHL
jgi:hypothetical protein